jgi:predicted RNA-binding Zn-ribbon protein involved in translation (DUF1610 family)
MEKIISAYENLPGFHRHKCNCGHIWSHSDNCRKNTVAHTCPNCGKEEWVRYNGPEPPTPQPVVSGMEG